MLTNQDAMELSKMMTAPDVFQEVRQDIARTLLGYYRELLAREPMQIPTVRRMWKQ